MECIDEIVSEAKTAAARDVALTMARTDVARYLEIVADTLKVGQPPSEVMNEFLRVLAVLRDLAFELFVGSKEVYWAAFNLSTWPRLIWHTCTTLSSGQWRRRTL